MTAMVSMKKYFAVYRRTNETRPGKINLEAADWRQALDDLYFYLNTTALGLEEYELFEIVDVNKYKPVACKIKPTEKPSAKELTVDVETKTFSERLYKSYRDVA